MTPVSPSSGPVAVTSRSNSDPKIRLPRAKLELGEQGADGFQVGFLADEAVRSDRHGNLPVDGRESVGEAGLVGIVPELLLLFALELIDVREDSLERAEPLEEFLGRFRADSRHARDIVGGVARKPQDIDHLVGALDAPFLTDRPGVLDLGWLTFVAGRYMNVRSETSWPKSLSGVTIYVS